MPDYCLGMGTAVIIIVIAALVVVVGAVAFLASRRKSDAGAVPITPVPPVKIRPPEEPMTGLESALAQVTDRDGKPIRERIDAEAGHVDELRVPDDTGPLLRRALDHVSPGDAAADPVSRSTDGTESDTDGVA